MPFVRGLMTIFIAGVGLMMCTVVGSLSYSEDGYGAIAGAIFGAVFFFLFGTYVTGFYQDFLPEKGASAALGYLPNSLAVQFGGHGLFRMIVTVHEVKDVAVQGRFGKPSLFVEVDCGENPIKRTCVSSTGFFNEQFKMKIQPADSYLFIRIKDQGLLGATSVGGVCIDIHSEILEPEDKNAFPSKRRFEIIAGQSDYLKANVKKGEMDGTSDHKAAVVLSFDYALDDHGDRQEAYDRDYTTKGFHEREQGIHKWDTEYGAVKFLADVQFNPSMIVPKLETRTGK